MLSLLFLPPLFLLLFLLLLLFRPLPPSPLPHERRPLLHPPDTPDHPALAALRLAIRAALSPPPLAPEPTLAPASHPCAPINSINRPPLPPAALRLRPSASDSALAAALFPPRPLKHHHHPPRPRAASPSPTTTHSRRPSRTTTNNNTRNNFKRRHPHILKRTQRRPLGPSRLSRPSLSPAASSRLVDQLLKHHYAADVQHEWSFPTLGNVRFTNHAPLAFAALREFFGCPLPALLDDLLVPFAIHHSEGKSDAAFLISASGSFLFKTLRGAEADNLKSFLPHYIPFVAANNDSLLPRFLGMFTFDPNHRLSASLSGLPAFPIASHSHPQSPSSFSFPSIPHSSSPSSSQPYKPLPPALQGRITILLMANVFDTPLHIDRRFDFKGSTVGRQALKHSDLNHSFLARNNLPSRAATIGHSSSTSSSFHDRRQSTAESIHSLDPRASIRSSVTLKELDYSRLLTEGAANLIQIGPERKAWLIDRLSKDTDLLKQHGFMDYSLLVGVHTHRKGSLDCALPGASGSFGSLSDTSTTGPTSSASVNDASATISRRAHLQSYLSAIQSLRNFMRGSPPNHSNNAWMNAIRSGRIGFSTPSVDDASSIAIDVESERSHRDYDDDDDDNDDEEQEDGTSIAESSLDGDGAASRSSHHRTIPPSKQFYGGMKSTGTISPDIDYEVYFFGLIDSLQKYDYFKWVERNVKRQTSQIIHSGPNALSSLFTGSNATLASQFSLRSNVGNSILPLSPLSPTNAADAAAAVSVMHGGTSSVSPSPLFSVSENGEEESTIGTGGSGSDFMRERDRERERHIRSRSATLRRFAGMAMGRPFATMHSGYAYHPISASTTTDSGTRNIAPVTVASMDASPGIESSMGIPYGHDQIGRINAADSSDVAATAQHTSFNAMTDMSTTKSTSTLSKSPSLRARASTINLSTSSMDTVSVEHEGLDVLTHLASIFELNDRSSDSVRGETDPSTTGLRQEGVFSSDHSSRASSDMVSPLPTSPSLSPSHGVSDAVGFNTTGIDTIAHAMLSPARSPSTSPVQLNSHHQHHDTQPSAPSPQSFMSSTSPTPAQPSHHTVNVATRRQVVFVDTTDVTTTTTSTTTTTTTSISTTTIATATSTTTVTPMTPSATLPQSSVFPSRILVYPENSVEEPGRYATRLVNFISSIII